MEGDLSLRIILETPPSGVEFGLQKGRGSTYEAVQRQISSGEDLYFEFEVKIKGDPTGEPDFSGPFVQGPRGGRFLYLDIGAFTGQKESGWSRRLKIPLSQLNWKMVTHSSRNPRAVLEARIPGTGRDGSPACGTVKAFGGWNLASQKLHSPA